MDGNEISRVVRCTETNAAEFMAMVNRWPELRSLVRSLRDADLFPGLRGMQVTLTGAPEWVAGGLASVAAGCSAKAAGGTHAH